MTKRMEIIAAPGGLLLTGRKPFSALREPTRQEICDVYLKEDEIDQIIRYLDTYRHGYIGHIINTKLRGE